MSKIQIVGNTVMQVASRSPEEIALLVIIVCLALLLGIALSN